jgi:endonuclease YncB( thermonuclease family)
LPHGLRPGERAAVARVLDGDALVLATGLSVRLAEIEAPAGATSRRAAQPFAEAAKARLEDLTLGRKVELGYGGLSRDRYERALAQAFVAGIDGRRVWLNELMVAEGLARVRSYADNYACVVPLLVAEADARAQGRGLWAEPAYRVRRAGDTGELTGLTVVEGKVAAAPAPLPEGEGRRDVAQLGFSLEGVDLGLTVVADLTEVVAGLTAGTQVRLRGGVGRRRRLEIDHAAQVEWL